MKEVIKVDNVSKKFIIHHERHRSFQDVMVNLFRSNGSREEFWALRDVSFGVRKGETVGLIGQNGSGKSTALKLISRIIDPTAGKVTVNGTISSLLELGAGFHPELSGRDNVFLNGSLLGISRRQMESKFDDIVGFAELWQFIDVPVKHYSSGMYMRLAFAVAINVDPDILLIDEVLSVGDQGFQEKCMERISDFQNRGKTIIFVSHALGTVSNICNRVIWLDQGRLRLEGESRRVVFEYLREVEAHQEAAEAEKEVHQSPVSDSQVGQDDDAARAGLIQVRDVKILGKDREERRVLRTGDDVVIQLHYVVQDGQSLQDSTFAISINEANGTLIHRALCPRKTEEIRPQGGGILELEYTALPLLDGVYTISVAVWPTDSPDSPFDVHHQRYRFSVEGGTKASDVPEDGVVSLRHFWVDPLRNSDVPMDDNLTTERADNIGVPSSNRHGDGSRDLIAPSSSNGEDLV